MTNSLDGVLGLLILGVAAVWLILIAYGITYLMTPYGPNFEMAAKVKTVSYESAKRSRGTGVGSNGQVITTTSYTPESYNVILSLDGGGLWELDNKDLFADADTGDKIIVTARRKTVWGIVTTDLVSWTKASK